MPLDEFNQALVEVKVSDFIESRRPEPNIRHKLDLGFRVEDQSVYIYEIRPHWKTGEVQHLDVAKTTYVKSQAIWKIFWMRSNGKWVVYDPCPSVKVIDDWVNLVDEDQHGCFWG